MTLESFLDNKVWTNSRILSGQCVPATNVSYGDLIIFVTLRDGSVNMITENPLAINRVLKEAHEAGEIVFKLIYLKDRDLYIIVSKDYVEEECIDKPKVEEDEDDEIAKKIRLFARLAGLTQEQVIKIFNQEK